jgi:hypothetical protein
MTQQKSPTGSNPQGKKRNVNVMDDGMNTTRFPLAGQGFSGCVPCANCPYFLIVRFSKTKFRHQCGRNGAWIGNGGVCQCSAVKGGDDHVA